MPYTHHRTWPDTDRDGYVIRCEGLEVGRVYRTLMPDGERWLWSVSINGDVPPVDGVPISGLAWDLDTATAELKAAYERIRAKADCQSRSGKIGDSFGPAMINNRLKPWNKPPACDPDKAAERLRRRFQRVSQRWNFRIRRRRFWRAVGAFSLTFATIIAVAWALLTMLGPWPPITTIKHLLAFPNCAAARAVGLAPARRGRPGYWASNDADNDGIACEPMRPRIYRG